MDERSSFFGGLGAGIIIGLLLAVCLAGVIVHFSGPGASSLPPGQCFHVADGDHVVTMISCQDGHVYRQVQPQEQMLIAPSEK